MPVVPSIALALAALITPGPASVTLAPEPMNETQIEVLRKARSMVSAMPKGVARDQAATYVAYRLMMRGRCSDALIDLNGELKAVVDLKALDGLLTGAVTGRDPRCMQWVATRVEAVLGQGTLKPEQRAELRLRGQTLLMLCGQLTRSYRMPAAKFETLDAVPEGLDRREVVLEGLTLDIELAEAATRRETLLLDRLWHYRNTELQLKLAQGLAKRAVAEPKFLTSEGWVDVALVLTAAGQRQAAAQLLTRADVGYMTLAGLDAEIALQRRDYRGAAAIAATHAWGTRGKTANWLITRISEIVAPYIDDEHIFVPGRDNLDLVTLSESLDRAGFTEDAERAAKASIEGYNKIHGTNRLAQALARVGDMKAATALMIDAVAKRDNQDAGHIRLGMARGAAFAGDLRTTESVIDTAPPAQQDWLLMNTLAAISRRPSPVRDALDKRLAHRAAQDVFTQLSPETLVELARGNLELPAMAALFRRLKSGRHSAAMVIRVAEMVRRYRSSERALAVAISAEALLPEGPQADAELVELADFYWRLQMPDEAQRIARSVSHPVGKIDALTRAINPTVGEIQPRLSFSTF